MKNIRQYFVNGAKTTNVEVAANSSNIAGLQQEEEEEELEEPVTKSKRKRVKIRISRTRDSKERTCDIVESKNDLIDKTPSPFNAKVTNGESSLLDGTPKSHPLGSSTERSLKKVLDVEFI